MDNKLSTGIVLLSFALLTACDSSEDNSTISSDGYIPPTNTSSDTETTVTEEETSVEESDSSESTNISTNSLTNGDFESWTDNVPDGWTTIDDGITVAKNTEISYSDSSSAEITVTTGTQGDTDFRQNVDVVEGTTYTFSAWFYHTEGYIRTTLYVDEFSQIYSDPDLINQWQEVTYSYLATESKSIEIGLRFYDLTGFDEQEVVYVDNLSLTTDSITETPNTDETEESGSTSESEETSTEESKSETTDEIEADLLLNGDFENWTASLPDDWTTIDTGITLTQNTDIYTSGSSAAEINVTTGEQGETDLRQSIDVVADVTYTFTTSFYHTEGNVKARLYIGNYADYSDNTLVDQWQTLTYSYTPTESGTIEVGVRFYDQTDFDGEEIVYIDNFSLVADSTTNTTSYYASADGLTGLELKTALYNIIKDHTTKTYSNLWDFMSENSLDYYYENDGSILDIYSENPSSSDSYTYTAVTDQCGNYTGEGSCYNREHSFPKSWFDDDYPMYTDIHHIFASDGYVNSKRSNYPYGEVATSTYVSDNGSKLGTGSTALGYTGTVFEPIDEFKGDLARAYFYMATRYQDVISTWESNSDNADAVLDGSADYVFEDWVITMLKEWNELDEVSQEELDRNEAAYEFQGNRNPFVDHPEYIDQIWAN